MDSSAVNLGYSCKGDGVRIGKRGSMVYSSLEELEESVASTSDALFVFTHPNGYEPVDASDVQAHSERYAQDRVVTAITTNGELKIIHGGPDDPNK